ncbi:hypothetical protein ACVWZK_003094 [Bradyrhizobium sp. GM0.4]
MRHFACYGDDRNKDFCVHCGGPDETKDHLPSKVLLDEPLPANVFVSPACFSCNNGLAPDEEYVAAPIECVLAGDVDPSIIGRPKTAKTLVSSVRLAKRLRRARRLENGSPIWDVEQDRLRNVVLKLARGHAAYELNDPKLEEPDVFWVRPLGTMTAEQIEQFEDRPKPDVVQLGVWPEVGSRMMSRLLIVENEVFEEGWLTVQEGRYRYKMNWHAGLDVRIVIREYLACQIVWE